jgi:hypothetical protein
MTNPPELISLYDGKYQVKNNNGVLEVYRHGERWPEKEKQLIGDGFVLALVQEIEELKFLYTKLERFGMKEIKLKATYTPEMANDLNNCYLSLTKDKIK